MNVTTNISLHEMSVPHVMVMVSVPEPPFSWRSWKLIASLPWQLSWAVSCVKKVTFVLRWVTPHDRLFIGVKVSLPLRDVTPATTAAEQAPDAFARDTAMEVPDGMQLWEPPAQPRHARTNASKTIAKSDFIGRTLVTQTARSKVGAVKREGRRRVPHFLPRLGVILPSGRLLGD